MCSGLRSSSVGREIIVAFGLSLFETIFPLRLTINENERRLTETDSVG